MSTVGTAHVETISTALARSVELAGVSDTPRLDVEVLLSHILKKDRSFLYAWPEQLLNEQQQQQFDESFVRRLKGEPVAHIIGQREFWSLPLNVTADTLIPRPETELLVELVLNLPLVGEVNLLDLGTGTGAIALAVASEKPLWQIIAVDAVAAAVQLAEENRCQLSTDQRHFDNVRVLQSDWFSALRGQKFDVIVGNPPYICAEDPHLQEGDVRFEPSSALVADDQGLSDLRYIINESRRYLNPEGWLLLEHGFDQGEAVSDLMLQAGFTDIATHADLAGRDRVSLCRC
jgi:release factor glutamine methyltransferase